ncbi:endophilin-A1 [Cricetulus griseus]|nr:endophilin-A1 [Cricetulus griseus]
MFGSCVAITALNFEEWGVAVIRDWIGAYESLCPLFWNDSSEEHPLAPIIITLKQGCKSKKVSEKVGGAEGTKLDDDFKEMERKVDVTSRAVMEIMTKTIEYLQPNPASRAKLSMINTMSKIRGQEKGPGYPQAEALLAEAMLKFGRELGDDCNFGPALGEVGEAMRELSEVKDSLDMEVKQNFIDPLQNLHDKDLREIQHHLKKLEGRRLDFDYKKKRQGKIPDEELRQALEKFDESKEIAESSMFNLLEMDIEQVSQLSALVQAQLEYHKQAVQILQQVTVRLEERIRQASSQPRREYQPKPRMSLEFATGDSTQPNGGLSHTGTPKPGGAQMDQPCCRALYDFEPENEGELGFKEGDIITLTNQIDENCHGSPVRHPEFYLSSCTGYFRGLMCCFRYATCSSGSCGVKAAEIPTKANIVPLSPEDSQILKDGMSADTCMILYLREKVG